MIQENYKHLNKKPIIMKNNLQIKVPTRFWCCSSEIRSGYISSSNKKNSNRSFRNSSSSRFIGFKLVLDFQKFFNRKFKYKQNFGNDLQERKYKVRNLHVMLSKFIHTKLLLSYLLVYFQIIFKILELPLY